MNRNQAKEFYPIMQAFAEGKVIECRTRVWELNKGWKYSTTWKETEELKFQDTYEYRIKPESTYRPFKNAEECWQEMQKHQPFGWVEVGDWYCTMREIRPTSAFCHGSGDVFHYKDMVKQITFTDGTPFGVKEEE